MKIKRILSSGLIFLVLLSSTECLSYDDYVSDKDSDQTTTHILESSHDFTQEFRESIKFNLSEESKSDGDVISHKATGVDFSAFRQFQYHNFKRDFLSKSPSKKRFIDFGALII